MELIAQDKKKERAFLVAVDTGDFNAEASLNELCELAESAGAKVAGTVLQKRPSPDAATCVGEGKMEEIRVFCEINEIDILIFDHELSPSQLRNIEQLSRKRVIDRTMLILDIFASRARSKEGRLQVELAQLQYLLPRLAGQGSALSRLGGGIGTRGPGETKLESDRRHIRRRIQALKEQLGQVEKRRGELRKRRQKDGILTVAIVGYTNAGKSTLMNYLTQAGVLAENKLFATLDPTARALKLPGGTTIMLVDTVGLVRRLPHHLVDAFKSTLEEAAQADVILNLCDASSEEALTHLEVTETLLQSLGCEGRPVLRVMNKCDLLGNVIPFSSGSIHISAVTGDGIPLLLQEIENHLPQKARAELLIPFSEGGIASKIREEALLLKETYEPEGIRFSAMLDPVQMGRWKKYVLPDKE